MMDKNPKIKNIIIRSHSSSNLKSNGYVDSKTEKPYLLKRYPKYYKTLTLDISDYAVKCRIKNLKQIKTFYGVFQEKPSKWLWLTLLNKQRKHLNAIPYTPFYRPLSSKTNSHLQDYNSSKIKLIPRVSKLQLPYSQSNLFPEYKIERMSLNISNLKLVLKFLSGFATSLKELKIMIDNRLSETDLLALQQIIASKKNLPSLNILDVYVESLSNSFSLSTALRNSFHNLTHLTLDIFAFPHAYSELSNIIKGCSQNLVYLSLLAGHDLYEVEPAIKQEYISFLQSFNKFEKLTTLHLCFKGEVSLMIKNLTLPFLIKQIVFNLEIVDEEELEIFDDFKESHPDFQRFLNEWSHLTHLESLKIDFFCFGQSPSRGKNLASPILKRIPCTTSFEYLEPCPSMLSDGSSHLSEILQSMAHFDNSLKNLTLISPNTDPLTETLLDSLQTFRGLEGLEIRGKTRVTSSPLERVIGLMERENENHSLLRSIRLDWIFITEYKHLEILLKILEEAKFTKTKKFSLKISVPNIQIEELFDGLKNFAKSCKDLDRIEFTWEASITDHKDLEKEKLLLNLFKTIEFHSTQKSGWRSPTYTYQHGELLRIALT